MSVVACVIETKKICLAADSRLSNSGSLRPELSFDKIKKIGNVIIGSVGTCQEIQILFNYVIKYKLPCDDLALVLYMANFYKWRNGINQKLEPEDKDCFSEGQFMFIVNKKVFAVNGLFVSRVNSFHAIGSGEAYAIGALANKASVVRAVEIACKYDAGCGMPIQYIEVKL